MSLHTDAPLPVLPSSDQRRRAHGLVMEMDHMGGLELNPSYQRSSVWAEDQQANLIRSMIMGLPVPSIVLADRTSWDIPTLANAVIDGKQRLETLRAWFTGKLVVPASWFPPRDVENPMGERDAPKWVSFNGLTQSARTVMKSRFVLLVSEVTTTSEQEEAKIFLLLNSTGVAQTDEDLKRAQEVARG